MIKILLYLFLIGHILGEYYLQSPTLIEKKNTSFKELMGHGLLYLLCLVILVLPIINQGIFMMILIITVVHLVVDYFMDCLYCKIRDPNKKEWLYMIKQLVQILVIFMSVGMIVIFQQPIQYINIINVYISKCSIDMLTFISWILVILIIIRPISISIRIFLKKYQPFNKADISGVTNAGSLIGILERIFILMMLSVGQYSAIGFVLTAKSIARYNKIVEDPQFSEYYLLGTLMSAILVIITYLLIM